jgi:2'-5' RNA ligase
VTRHATARLFVALELPSELRAQLAGWARRCASHLRTPAPRDAGAERPRQGRPGARGELRLLQSESLHLTLCFLGDRPLGEIDALGEALALALAAAPPLGQLALGAPLWLPPRRPRALAVELHDDAQGSLQLLHDALLRELSEVCDLEPDTAAAGAAGRAAAGARRRFRPHITVARMRSADAPRERVLPATPALAFTPQTLTLYRSWLTPTAAEYEGLVSHALAGAD